MPIAIHAATSVVCKLTTLRNTASRPEPSNEPKRMAPTHNHVPYRAPAIPSSLPALPTAPPHLQGGVHLHSNTRQYPPPLPALPHCTCFTLLPHPSPIPKPADLRAREQQRQALLRPPRRPRLRLQQHQLHHARQGATQGLQRPAHAVEARGLDQRRVGVVADRLQSGEGGGR